jgi:hypothetical protein
MPTLGEVFTLAVQFHQKGNLAQAEPLYRQILQADPSHPDALHMLGMLAQQTGHPDAALALIRRALAVNPDNADAQNSLGTLLKDQDQLAEATACFRRALQLHPGYANAHCNLGNVLKDQGELSEAAASYRQALLIDPCHKPTLWNRALLRLLQGHFADGWPDFELRFARPGMGPRLCPQPRWDGTPLDGKTILVHAELGLGDTIQFARYLPMVKARAGNVIFECQPSLIALFKRLQGADQIIAAGSPVPPFDVHIPLLSLPGLFGTTLDTIPADIPYVSVDATPMSVEPTTATKIGIAWQANPRHQGHRHKSFSLSSFEALAHLEKVRLFSLQVGPGLEQLATASFPVTDLGSKFDLTSLADLAAALMNLDLVITVDTAVAHLAGAMGIPAWVPLPLIPDWRWLLARNDSPWYPTMRLFRQTKLGDWGEVFQQITEQVRSEFSDDGNAFK